MISQPHFGGQRPHDFNFWIALKVVAGRQIRRPLPFIIQPALAPPSVVTARAPDAAAAGAALYRKTGIYPINHTVVVKDALLQSDPALAPRLFAGFEAAKAQFLKQLSSAAELPVDAQVLATRRSIVGDDQLPNGLAHNRKALEAIVQFAHEQKIPPRTVSRRRCSRPTR
jgi:hypothetical protein